MIINQLRTYFKDRTSSELYLDGVKLEGNAFDHGGLGLLSEAYEAGWAMDELATILGVSRATMRNWMRDGKITQKYADKINGMIGARR